MRAVIREVLLKVQIPKREVLRNLLGKCLAFNPGRKRTKGLKIMKKAEHLLSSKDPMTFPTSSMTLN